MSSHVAVSGVSVCPTFSRNTFVFAVLATLALGTTLIPSASAQSTSPPPLPKGKQVGCHAYRTAKNRCKTRNPSEATPEKLSLCITPGGFMTLPNPKRRKQIRQPRDAGKPFDFPLGGTA